MMVVVVAAAPETRAKRVSKVPASAFVSLNATEKCVAMMVVAVAVALAPSVKSAMRGYVSSAACRLAMIRFVVMMVAVGAAVRVQPERCATSVNASSSVLPNAPEKNVVMMAVVDCVGFARRVPSVTLQGCVSRRSAPLIARGLSVVMMAVVAVAVVVLGTNSVS
jgi:hypothetical protein